MAKNAVHCGYYVILLWSRFTSLLDLLKHENWTEQTLLTLQRLDVRYIWCANKAPSRHNDIVLKIDVFFLRFRKNTRPHPSQSMRIFNSIRCMTSLYSETSECGALDFSIRRVQSPKTDQHPIFFACDINGLKIRVVMRITDMITQDEFVWYFINFSPLLL